MKKYDIIIIGAGCSGLSLAYRLINSNLKVCLLESGNRNDRVRKTWSYWDIYNHPFKSLENNSLTRLEVNHNASALIDCEKYNYKSIDSYDFDDLVFEAIDKAENIEIEFSSCVKEINEKNNLIMINNNGTIYQAQKLFDSRPLQSAASMFQVFLGYYITSNSFLSNTKAQLMDFTDGHEFSFYYVLPFKHNTVLCEYTFFTSKIYTSQELEKELVNYINKNLTTTYDIVRSEYGIIPMTSVLPKQSLTNNIFKIGITSGATRASTGYTFLNIQKQSDYFLNMINNIKSANPLFTPTARVLRKMDNVMLEIVKNEPIVAKDLMFQMMKKNKDETIIKFLSDIPSLFDLLRIIFNMPKLIFIKYAIKSIFRQKT